MSCPECDRPLLWGGMSYVEHTDGQHALYRHTLLSAVARQLRHMEDITQWRQQNTDEELLGIRWRNGVYPGWQTEERWEVPQEWWDSAFDDVGGQPFILRVMREYLTDQLKEKHGLTVNQATWFHKIYDGRTP